MDTYLLFLFSHLCFCFLTHSSFYLPHFSQMGLANSKEQLSQGSYDWWRFSALISLVWRASSDSGDASSIKHALPVASVAPPFSGSPVTLLQAHFLPSCSSTLWSKNEFLPRLCPRTTFLTLYSFPWKSHFVPFATIYVLMNHRCMLQPRLLFSLTLYSFFSLSSSPHFLTSVWCLPILFEQTLGSLVWPKGPSLPGHGCLLQLHSFCSFSPSAFTPSEE